MICVLINTNTNLLQSKTHHRSDEAKNTNGFRVNGHHKKILLYYAFLFGLYFVINSLHYRYSNSIMPVF